MNKLLAFSQKRIPYIPELKSLCDDSIPATILMMQMEYWFASHPDGFYKFLKPCDHEKYHQGDSWTEELQFSEHEFRSSFDKIGLRYKSKSQLEQVPLGVDIFQGRYYLSYFDTRKSMTVYLRNHSLMDEKLEALMEGFRPQPIRKKGQLIDFNKDAKIQSPEMENFNLRRLKKSRSGDSKFQSAYIGTDITTQDYIQKTAAEDRSSQKGNAFIGEIQDSHAPIFAAAVVLKKQEEEVSKPEPVIGQMLTKNQQAVIARMTAACEPNTAEQKKVQEEIEFSMLDMSSFTQAGNDFLKKLNTIKKCLREGRWSTPTKFHENARQKIATIEQESLIKEKELQSECAHWKYIAEIHQERNQEKQAQWALVHHKKAVELLRTFREAQAKFNSQQEAACTKA